MADEEPVNPQIEVEESCKPQCVKAWLEYQVGKGQCRSWADGAIAQPPACPLARLLCLRIGSSRFSRAIGGSCAPWRAGSLPAPPCRLVPLPLCLERKQPAALLQVLSSAAPGCCCRL